MDIISSVVQKKPAPLMQKDTKIKRPSNSSRHRFAQIKPSVPKRDEEREVELSKRGDGGSNRITYLATKRYTRAEEEEKKPEKS